jgi:hypothetical protein
MRSRPFLLRLLLLSGLAFCAACATSRAQRPTAPEPQHVRGSAAHEARPEPPESRAPLQQAREAAGGFTRPEPLPVLISTLPGGLLRLSFPTSPHQPGMEKLGLEEIRPLLAAFGSFRPPAHPRLRLMREAPEFTSPHQRPPSPWESRLRGEFLSQYGPALLPLPESLESSRLSVALKLSTRYMDDGIREAAQELFNARNRSQVRVFGRQYVGARQPSRHEMVDQRLFGHPESQIVLDCKCPKTGGILPP